MESHVPCSHYRRRSIAWKSDDLGERAASGCKPLRSTFPSKHSPECPRFGRITEEEARDEIASCAEKFSLAKRLHAENLQHQPLPDRVDDSVFRSGHHRPGSVDCECGAQQCRRYHRAINATTSEANRRAYGPALGCKKPRTRMDLAICWETPIDTVYEPRRATHIDGTEGGEAPAIFALIQHTPAPRNRELLSRARDETTGCDCVARRATRPSGDEKTTEFRCRCNCFRDELGDDGRGGKLPRSNSVPRITERRCAACRGAEAEHELRRDDPRLVRSAVGVVLDLEDKRRTTVDGDATAAAAAVTAARRNGLPPPRMTVPRPRTPFARRAFCIDTLAPPFSVMNGCRDADYPEHWRLMSVYQQSYRNPQKRRTRRF